MKFSAHKNRFTFAILSERPCRLDRQTRMQFGQIHFGEKTMKNQPGTMKTHENQPGTTKNQPGTMKNHENQPGIMKKHEKPTWNLKKPWKTNLEP